MAGSLPENVLSEFTSLFADCRAPLDHRGTINVQAAPFQGQTIDAINVENYSENPTYSTVSFSNPYSELIFNDAGDPITVNNGFTLYNPGVSWWQYAMVYWLQVNNSKIKNLKIENLKKDGYQFEDINVVVDITVDTSDPCNPSITPVYKSVKVLVDNKDADSGSGDDEDSPSSPDGTDPTSPSTPSDPSIPNNDPHNSGDTSTSTSTAPASGGANDSPFWDTTIQEGYPPLGDTYIPPTQDEEDK